MTPIPCSAYAVETSRRQRISVRKKQVQWYKYLTGGSVGYSRYKHWLHSRGVRFCKVWNQISLPSDDWGKLTCQHSCKGVTPLDCLQSQIIEYVATCSLKECNKYIRKDTGKRPPLNLTTFCTSAQASGNWVYQTRLSLLTNSSQKNSLFTASRTPASMLKPGSLPRTALACSSPQAVVAFAQIADMNFLRSTTDSWICVALLQWVLNLLSGIDIAKTRKNPNLILG